MRRTRRYDRRGLNLRKINSNPFPPPPLLPPPTQKIKEECKATIRCYPVDVNEMKMFEGKKCFYSGEDADKMALFGRAF